MSRPGGKLPLVVLNLWAGPGVGKSTTAAGLFNLMKLRGDRVELVSEFAKDLTYQRDYGTLENQLLVLSQQDARLRRLVGQVAMAITDSPLPLALAYATPEYLPWLADTVVHAFGRYRNINILLKRVKQYQPFGRLQSEDEATRLDATIAQLYDKFRGPTEPPSYRAHVAGDFRAPREIDMRIGPWDGLDP